MKCIVCYSGGHSSALVAIETVRKHGKENVILLNHDISSEVEHADIKRFKRDVADYLDLDITYANMEDFEKLSPLKLCKEMGIFKYHSGHAVCTHKLKTEPFMNWLKSNFPASADNVNERCKVCYGFDLNEEHRITRRVGIMATQGYITEFPLIWKDRTIQNTEEIGVLRPITYKLFKHANCIGCLKAGRQHWYLVYCLYPHIFEEAKENERQIGHSIIKDVFLEELEPKFKQMQADGICPNEKEQAQSFWAKVNKQLPEQQTFLPCDCAVL